MAIFGVDVKYQHLAPSLRAFESGADGAERRVEHRIGVTADDIPAFR
jgi:hypothetical protein